jgi:uncharacterized protein with HEPN domain
MQHRDKQIIKKLISECEALAALKEGFAVEMFLGDERTKRAISMTLINIGELVKGLSDDVRQEYKTIPWKLIAGIRDVAAHHYQTLKMEDVWLTANNPYPWHRLWPRHKQTCDSLWQTGPECFAK